MIETRLALEQGSPFPGLRVAKGLAPESAQKAGGRNGTAATENKREDSTPAPVLLERREPPGGLSHKDRLAYQEGLVSIQRHDVPLISLLEEIASAAGVEIVVFDPVEPASISVHLVARPLDQALRSILKSYNHTVIYNPEGGSHGVRLVHHTADSAPGWQNDSRQTMQSARSPEGGSSLSEQTIRRSVAAIQRRLAGGTSVNASRDQQQLARLQQLLRTITKPREE